MKIYKFFLILFLIPFISAQATTQEDLNKLQIPITTSSSNIISVPIVPIQPDLPINSSLSTNNSYYWQGYVPSTLPHNGLAGLQGDGPDYYHLSQFEKDSITNATNVTMQNYVPYQGAIKDVDLGVYSINASNLYLPVGGQVSFDKSNLTNAYIFYNSTSRRVELWANGHLQQDWGNSTTIYGKATFEADAYFKNMSGEGLFINTNVIVDGNLTVYENAFAGNLCYRDGTNCTYFNGSLSNLTDMITSINQSFFQQIYILQGQIGNETLDRINNDSYLQGQINNLSSNFLNTTSIIPSSQINQTGIYWVGLSLNNILDSIYSWLTNLNDNKLNATDQRYNDTALIDTKLNITDQRYNDTALINNINTNFSNYYTKLETDSNLSIAIDGFNNIKEGLVAYYKLNQNNANQTDSSGNRHDANVSEAVYTSNGKIGGAYNFDGVNDVINLGNSADFSPTEITYGTWFNTKRLTTNLAIMSKRDGGGEYNMMMYSTTQFSCRVYNATSSLNLIVTVPTFTTNTWYYGTCVYNGTNVIAYLNGVQIGIGYHNGALATTSSNVTMGFTTGNNYWNGTLDEVRIYNRSLTANEISQIYTSTTPRGKLDIEDQRYNDTAYISLVNQSLTNLSRLKYHQENITITTSAGVGGGISTSLVGFLITEIKVTPTSLTSQYKFKATTYAGNIIDQDRVTHTGIWDIEKNYAINDKVVINITNSNPAIETYTININYIDNFRP